MKVDDTRSWAVFGIFFLATIEVIVIQALLYVNWAGGNIEGILKFNFWSFLLIGLFLFMFIVILLTLKFIVHSFNKVDSKKGEWDEEW